MKGRYIMKTSHKAHVFNEKQLKLSLRNAQRNRTVIRIPKKHISVYMDYSDKFLSHHKFNQLVMTITSPRRIKRKSKRYFIIYGAWFNYLINYQDCNIYHELGHIVNGDLSNLKSNMSLNQARILDEPSEENPATKSEILADEYAISLCGKPDHAYDWIYDMYKHISASEDLSNINARGLKELEIRMNYIRNKYAKYFN